MISNRLRVLACVVIVTATLTGCAGGPPRDEGQAGNGLVGPGGAAGQATSDVYPPAERSTVKGLNGELLDGSPFDPESISGQVVVVNFWASWCAPCRAELPELNAASAATEKLGVQFVGVNVRDSRDAARSFVEGREEYPSLFDPSGRVVLGFDGVSAYTIPATVILDRQGRAAAVLRKAVTEQELVPLIKSVTGESSAGR